MTAPKPRDELVRRPNGSGREPIRSIRCGDDAWKLIRRLAGKRGIGVGAYLFELAKADEMFPRQARRRR